MKACIASYYMENISMATVEAQYNVVKKFNASKYPHYMVQGEMRHGHFIDYFWALNGQPTEQFKEVEPVYNFDVILFLDIDCVPLSPEAIDFYIKEASEGKLIGNAQRSGHIDNGDHLFAAPSAIALSKETYDKIGRPSAIETPRSDVAEEYTWAAQQTGVDVFVTAPSKFDRAPFRYDWETDKSPYWELRNGLPNYGLGTTYTDDKFGDVFYHNFQIRVPGEQEHFRNKCAEILSSL